jgi:hypothetical protein
MGTGWVGAWPHVLSDTGGVELGHLCALWSIVARIKALIVKRLIHAKPVGFVDAKAAARKRRWRWGRL